MKSNIFIPKKIKIGFNLRQDTYTGKLGYVIYHDGKTWRKENSWESWRQKEGDVRFSHYELDKDGNPNYNKQVTVTLGPDINPLEYTNESLEGFVLNKKVGGHKSDWNFRQAYTRVYDPRGFEFEITIPNLLYILENANCIKGKGLEGKFIYGWDGKDLVLIPEEAPEYKSMVDFTDTLGLKVSKKDLKVGGIYLTASGAKVTFMVEAPEYDYYGVTTGDKKLWFNVATDNQYKSFTTMSMSTIKKYVGDNEDIANLFDQLEGNTYYKPKNALIYTYEPYTSFQFKQSNYSNNREEVYIQGKTKGNYKRVYICQTWRENEYYLSNGYRGNDLTERYKTLKELITNHPIYYRIKTQTNEKQRQDDLKLEETSRG
jgi:hypothetical protein